MPRRHHRIIREPAAEPARPRLVNVAEEIITIQLRKTALKAREQKLQLELDSLDSQFTELSEEHNKLQRELDKLATGDRIQI